MPMKPSALEERIFYALLALLVWLPLPFGSNRLLAETIFWVWVSVLAGAWLYGWTRGGVQVGTAFRGAIPMLGLLGGWLLYLAIPIIPLPVSLVAFLSPESAASYSAAGVSEWVTISVFPWISFQYWLKSAAYATLFVLLLLLVNDKRRLVSLAFTLVASAVFQAFYGSMMTLSGVEYGFFVHKESYVGYATGTFVNRNHLAGYLEMTLAVGIGLLMAGWTTSNEARNWKQRVKGLAQWILSPKFMIRMMLAVMVIALVLTRSRMGNTGFFASMLIAGSISLVMFRMQSSSVRSMFSKRETRSAVILLSTLLAIDLLIVGTWFGMEKVVQRIEQSSLSHDRDRVEVSLNTLNLIRDYPVFGSGGGSFHTVYPRYRPPTIGAYYDHVHQDYLEFTADTGLIGISILGAMVLTSLGAALVAMYRRRDALMKGMAFSSVMGITALLIHSTVDFNLQIPANAATFMCILALGWIALNLERHTEKHAKQQHHLDTI